MFTREQIIEAMAQVYVVSYPAAAVVGKICDEQLDRSGRLLGEVREAVRRNRKE